VSEHSAEISGIQRGCVYQRQECDFDCEDLPGKTKNFTGENFWARGYVVSTVGLDEERGGIISENRNVKRNVMSR